MSDRGFAAIPDAGRYVLRNAHLPACLLSEPPAAPTEAGLLRTDLLIEGGRVAALGPVPDAAMPALDLDGGMVLPGFVDMHTHLDKGHIWPRARNADGTFGSAIQTVAGDRSANWSAADVEARMEFSLRCAEAHGTVAIRTHLDSLPPQDGITWPVFERVRERWRGRIELQPVALIHADAALDPAVLTRLAPRVAAMEGSIGGAIASHPRTQEAVTALVRCAAEHGLGLDLHLDETLDPASQGLLALADAVIDTGFSGPVVAGHCCSLAAQDAGTAMRTIERVARAGIGVVSLPMCNLYLQGRRPGETPRVRGVTLLRELAKAGVRVAVSSDNTRDPFYAYGDLDPLEVLRESVRIAHQDHPVEEAVALVTRNPADIAGFAGRGRIGVGLPADLVLLRGRDWSEVLARPQADRTVLRAGRPIRRALPDYRELDALFGVARAGGA